LGTTLETPTQASMLFGETRNTPRLCGSYLVPLRSCAFRVLNYHFARHCRLIAGFVSDPKHSQGWRCAGRERSRGGAGREQDEKKRSQEEKSHSNSAKTSAVWLLHERKTREAKFSWFQEHSLVREINDRRSLDPTTPRPTVSVGCLSIQPHARKLPACSAISSPHRRKNV
jgi:hypothetical protein